MAKIGYARVSSIEQNEARQLAAFEQISCDKVFLDKLSGKDMARPGLAAMLDYVREGDTVFVTEYARLARSVRDLLTIIDKLQAKGVAVVSQKENFDTNTPQGKLMLTIFGALAEFEREVIKERQREGIEIAKTKGKYSGRKPVSYDEKLLRKECRLWRAGSQTAADTMKKTGLKPNTFYRTVKKLGI